jgi:hypothetical protein
MNNHLLAYLSISASNNPDVVFGICALTAKLGRDEEALAKINVSI